MSTIHLGKRIGSRVVIDGYTERTDSGNHKSKLVVRCDCGDISTIKADRFLSGRASSCKPCSVKRRARESALGTNHPLYSTWKAMIDRCTNSLSTSFKNYGGRGIQVCQQWQRSGDWGDMSGFHNFVKDMGDRPHGTSLDRIDNNGNYEPGNCRWATDEQQANNKRTNVYVTIGDTTMTFTEWARYLDVPDYKFDAPIKKYGIDPVVVISRYVEMTPEERCREVVWGNANWSLGDVQMRKHRPLHLRQKKEKKQYRVFDHVDMEFDDLFEKIDDLLL